ncbi:MAG TPA: tyrosine-type recombinase/integrase [Solirubrobacteraceae bacterium]|jgi:integrase|nr:tyrosine-type recombinase/integrase [Solirubrobacteraceae bacterium]
MSGAVPRAALVVRVHNGKPFYEAKFRYEGKQVKRRIGPAWLEAADQGWQKRKGRVTDGHFDERMAHVEAASIAAKHVREASERERVERERRTNGVPFRQVAHAYLAWLGETKGAKPSTQADYAYLLAEEGIPAKRGTGKSKGYIMRALGERPAATITGRDVEAMLKAIASTGVSARSVNKHRALVSAIFNYGMRESTFGLPANPVSQTDKRREPQRDALAYYSPEEVEVLARALEAGQHRDPSRAPVNAAEKAARIAEDHRDAALIRTAAYSGLRLGELLALRWGDIDYARSTITVRRAVSAGEMSSTKSGRIRQVPLPDQLAAVLISQRDREDFTSDDDLVFCNHLGRPVDGSALRRRYKAGRDAAGLRELRFHDLRHTYGSNLAAAGVDLVMIQAVMGHGALSTTSRYLHARPASEQAKAFTRVFELSADSDSAS